MTFLLFYPPFFWQKFSPQWCCDFFSPDPIKTGRLCMQHLLKLCAPAILILGLGLTGCDSNDKAAKEPAPVEEPAADQDLIEPAGGGETTMPGNAKPARDRKSTRL